MIPPPQLSALILSEFHSRKGFTIIEVVQAKQYITPNLFGIYSQLILYREQLCGRLLVSEFTDKYYLIGVPSLSTNQGDRNVYERAKYLYAASVLVKKEKYLDQRLHQVYKQIAIKISHFFKFVEVLYFLSKQTSNAIYYNTENKQYLHYLLEKVYRSVNLGQQCVLSHFSTCYTIINLNCSPYPRDRKQIKKSSVPITFLQTIEIESIQSQMGKQLLNYAKIGDYNVRKICELVQDQKAVYKYYQKCMEMGIVFMVDMFSLENRYYLTQNIHKYLANQKELEKICEQVKLKRSTSTSFVLDQIAPTPNILKYLYFQMSRKDPLKKIIDSNIQLVTGINVLKWIRISQVLGIIGRAYEKFVIDDNRQQTQEFKFISEESLNNYMSQSLKGAKGKDQRGSDNSRTNSYTLHEQCERMNSLFNAHLKNMDSIEQICVSMKINRESLFAIIGFEKQRNLKVVLVSE